jgi:hypothetical protein
MANADYLADVLRAAGLTVTEEPGWEKRGRPGAFDPKGVLIHHTSSNPRGGNLAALRTVRDGRPEDGLPGPLSQLMVARDGTWHVVAAGRCNHAGKGKWRGLVNGNRDFIGVECENDGRGEVWPEAQLDSIARGTAALLGYLKADDSMAPGHKEYAEPRGRKVDPTFDMVAFRADVAAIMGGKVVTAPVALPVTVDRTRAMLFKGHGGPAVKLLQQLLNKNGAKVLVDGDFGPATENAVKAFQRKRGLVVDGKVGPATWGALGVK